VTATEPSPGQPPSKGDRTRQSLLSAAIERFARDGFRGTSVADVCRDAGLSTTASYPYFPNKEALFVAAVDEDVDGLIRSAITLEVVEKEQHWGHTMMRSLIARSEQHPLARRIISGLEPDFTVRMLDIPALTQLRKDVAELMRALQVTGDVRRDIEPEQISNGIVVIVISLLMTSVQTGGSGFDLVAADVEAVLDAATRPPGDGTSPRREARSEQLRSQTH
jgi:AcrR family transcriptional regulator